MFGSMIIVLEYNKELFKKYPWLDYSRAEDGAFCQACAFFAPKLPGGHSTGQFVTAPFRAWRKLSDRTLAHGKLDYHLASLAKMSAFLDFIVTHHKLLTQCLYPRLASGWRLTRK